MDRRGNGNSSSFIALKGAAVYALFGVLWIYFSDFVLALFVKEPGRLTTMQTYKGWFFIFVTAWLVYYLLRRHGVAVWKGHEDLEKSEASLDQLFRALPVGVGTVKNRILTSVNERLCEITGYSMDEVVGHETRKFYVDDDEFERVGREVYRQTAETGRCFLEARWRHKSGEVRDVLLGAAVASEGADPMDIVFSAMDTTEQRAQEAWYRLLFEGAHDALMLMDGVWFVDCNARAQEIYGAPRERIVGANPLVFSPEKQPDGSDSATAAKGRIEAALAGEPQVFEWLHKRWDGNLFNSEISLNRLQLGGGRPHLLAIARDITQRKRNEAARHKSESITKALYAISNAVSSTSDMDELYGAIHQILSEHIDATNFYIGLVDKERDTLEFPIFIDEHDGPYVLENISDPEVKTMTLEVIRSGQTVLVGESGVEGVVSHASYGYGNSVGTRSAIWLGVPLAVGGEVLGAMAVQHYSDPYKYGPEDKAWMSAVSEQVALAIERKRTLEALKASEEFLNGIFRTVPMGIGVIEDRVLVTVNDRFCEIFGFSREELLGQGTSKLYASPEEWKRCGKEIYDQLEEKGVSSVEGHMVRSDGEEIHVLINSSPIDTPGGGQAVTSSVLDITARKRTLEALKKSEAHLASIFRAVPTGISVVRNRVMETVNDQFCEIFGYERDELAGRNTRMLFSSDEEYRRCGDEVYGQIARHGIGSSEGYMLRKDGEEIYVLINSAVISSENGETTVTSSVLDMTERKRTLEALKKSEDYVTSIFRAAPIGISVVEDRMFTTVNDRFCDIFGYDREELVGQSTRKLYVSEEEFLRCGKEYIKGLEEQGTCSVEAHGVRKDGKDIYLLVNASVLAAQGGMRTLTFCVMDITDLKKTMEALKKSQESLASTFLTVPTGIGVFKDRHFVDANERFHEILGYETGELVGESTRILYVSEEEYERCGREIYGGIKEHGRCSVEAHMVRKDGRDIHVLINGSPLSPDTDETAITSSILDITDRKRTLDELRQSEDKYRRLVEDMGDRFCLFRHDTDGVLTYLSPGFEGVFGVPLEQGLSRDWHDILDWSPGTIERAERHDRALFEGTVDSTTYEMAYRHGDGTERTVEISEHLVFDDGGKPQALEGIAVNITDRKRAEEDLRTNHDRLEEMVRERTGELTESNAELQRLIEDSETRSEQAEILNDMGDLLQACETEDETYQVVSGVCAKLFPGESGCIGILDDDDWSIKVVGYWGDVEDCNMEFAHNDCWAIRRGKAHLVLEPDTDPLCNHVRSVPECGTLCVPMGAKGRVLGMAYMLLGCNLKNLEERELRRVVREKRILLSGLVERYAPSLVNLRLRETLREQSIRDRLTGLFNRRHMEETLTRELSRARRRKQPLGVIMIDVDHFKQFNDTYGHETGDVVLRELGAYLKESVRAEDIPCRYGGEELLLIFPDGGLKDSVARAEDIRRGIAEEVIALHNGRRLQVTASLGVAAFPDHGRDVESLLAAADAALYRAKEEGRNRVVAYEG